MLIIVGVILLILLWFITGCGSFWFWWTKVRDLTLEELPIMFLCGFTGPFSFLIGWAIHGTRSYRGKVVFKQRHKNWGKS